MIDYRPMQVHGESGLDGMSRTRLFPESARSHHPMQAVLAMADKIRALEADERLPLQLICTGSLTNPALLLTLFPGMPVDHADP